MKKALPVVIIVVLLLYALNLEITGRILGKVATAFSPLFVGVFFALILKAPVDFLEKYIFSSPKLGRVARPLSLAIILVLSLGFTFLIGYLVVPELGKSVTALKESVEWLLGGGMKESLPLPEKLIVWLKKALERGLERTDDILLGALEGVGNTLKGIVNGFLGLMLAITMVLGKDKILAFVGGVSRKMLGSKRSEFVKGAFGVVVDKFSRYLGGSIIEALIFGGVCYLAFIIFKIPYPLLLAVVVGVFNLIPTVGGYIGGGIGVLVLITVGWKTALIFVAITFVLQQVEQVTTYPIVVGRYVGLSPFFVLLAVVVGGGLFGFWGLLLGVPVVAFMYNLVTVLINSKAEKD